MAIEFGAAFAAVKKGLQAAKELASADAKLEAAELKLRVADITSAFADAQMALTEAQSRIQELEQKEDLKAQLEPQGKVLGFKGEPPPGFTQGPFCPTCFNTKKELVQLSSLEMAPEMGDFLCSTCKGMF